MHYKILIVDDDIELCNLLKQCLEIEGYIISVINDGKKIKSILSTGYDLIILDVMLPGINGIDILKYIRQVSNIPVLMLSAKCNEMDKVLGLKTGADDYLSKPFGLSELIARVQSLLRRFTLLGSSKNKESVLNFGEFKIDTKKCNVTKRDTTILLTPKEYKLLCFLAQNPGQVFTKKQIYQNVWEENYVYDDNTIMALIRRLRKKIEDTPENPIYIKTVWGIGYRFNKEA